MFYYRGKWNWLEEKVNRQCFRRRKRKQHERSQAPLPHCQLREGKWPQLKVLTLSWQIMHLKEFKLKAHLARHYATAHGLAIRSGSPRPIMKTRTAFYLFSTPLTRVSRRLCRNLLLVRHAARAPFWPINITAVKTDCNSSNFYSKTLFWHLFCLRSNANSWQRLWGTQRTDQV